jgi:hypothetical protein
MRTKVGAWAWADDPLRRFAVAVPGAIAITAAFFALGRCQPADQTLAEHAPATTVVLERAAPTPPPTPAPRPTPPPTLPPVPHVTLAPIPQRAAPKAVAASGGGHAAPRTLPHVAPLQTIAGSGGGAGPGTGDGEGAGDAGGTGNGTGGTGSGTVNADVPCGSVDLIPIQSPDHNGALTFEHIRATVTFGDGHTQSEEFPYRWSYSDPNIDPWSPRNMPNPDFPAHVQLPPPGANTSRYPELIRYILDHTRSDGTTILQECPRQR